MAQNWYLGDFMTGQITRSIPLPVKDGNATIDIDIHGEDNAEVSISCAGLSVEENNDWQNVFAPILNFMILDDDTKEWNDPDAIQFFGMINKLSNEIAPSIISVQIAGVNEYTKARIIGEASQTVSDPNAVISFTGATWSDVLTNMFVRCFSAAGIPAGEPTPPQILGTVPVVAAGSLKKDILITDAMTYHAAATDLSQADAGNGLEWKWKAVYTSAARSAVKVDLIVGTAQVPHIGEDTTVPIYLAENDTKFSAFSTTINSNELYSKLYIQSKPGDLEAGTGADFTPAAVSNSEFPILVERFFNPGVELTSDEMSAQLSSRLGFAAKIKYENGFSVEEKWDSSEWINRVGNVLVINGLAGTISAGHNAIVRCVGISWQPGTGTVRAELMQLGPTYPRLPKNRAQELIPNESYNSSPVQMPVANGGGVTPTPTPTIPTGPQVDGVSLDGLYGDEQRNPWDGKPEKITNPVATDYKDIDYLISQYDGDTPIHPYSMCAADGNRIYGTDHVTQVAGTTFVSNSPTHYAGGLNWLTGEPLNGWQPFHIKKTYFLNGEMGPVETVGVVDAAKVKSMIVPWETHEMYGSDDANYETGILSANWITKGRFFFALASIYRHKLGSDYYRPGTEMAYHIYDSNVRVISALLLDDGKVSNEWQDEDNNFPNFGFPMTPFINVVGDTVIFTSFYQVTRTKFKDMLGSQWADWRDAQFNATGGWGPLDTDWWYSPPFGNAILWQDKLGTRPNNNIPGIDWGLGNLWKDYSKADSEFSSIKGYNNTEKRNSGGVTYGGFVSDGYAYAATFYSNAKLQKLKVGEGAIPAGDWVPVTEFLDGAVYTSGTSVSKGVAYLSLHGSSIAAGKRGGRLVATSTGSIVELTTEPYSNFVFLEPNQDIPVMHRYLSNGASGLFLDGKDAASRIFSYDGRFYTVKLLEVDGVKNTLKLHSMQISQA